MYSEPWAKFTTRVTPKISDNPAATRNSAEAPARPLRSWARREAKDTRGEGVPVRFGGRIPAILTAPSPQPSQRAGDEVFNRCPHAAMRRPGRAAAKPGAGA